MTDSARFSNWAALDKPTQTMVAATAIDRAHRLEPRLRAFVKIEHPDVESSTKNALTLIPYAAKDLFVAPKHRPKGGLADVLDFGLNGYADVLRRLDDAGACRVGFTAMTELARAVRLQRRFHLSAEPLESRFHHGRIVICIGSCGYKRSGGDRAWFGYRWIDSHPFALHGGHRMEAELGRGECYRCFASCAIP